MAKLVMGLGTPQSPLVSIEGAHWGDYGDGDKTSNRLYRPDGTLVTYEQLAAEAGDKFRDTVAIPNFIKVSAQVQKAVQRLAGDLAAAEPNLLVVIADDQAELFDNNNMPAISIYRGAELSNRPKAVPSDAPQWVRDRHDAATIAPQRHYPGAPDFADELIKRLIDKQFDIAAVGEPSHPDKGIGHAWAFITNRLAGGHVIPIVPIVMNTWYPPNVPTPERCYKLGQALRAAIEESPRDLRVGIVAAGGMSHFVLNEQLDRHVMAALRSNDIEALKNLPRGTLVGGTGQILDWIVLAGSVEKLKLGWADYWPGYRSAAGTGCGLAFASWS